MLYTNSKLQINITCTLRVLEAAFTRGGITNGETSWVVSTRRSPVPTSLHSLVLQLKPSLFGLRTPEHPLLPPSLLVLIQVTRKGGEGQGIGVCSSDVLLDRFVGHYVLNLLPSPGVPTLWLIRAKLAYQIGKSGGPPCQPFFVLLNIQTPSVVHRRQFD